MPIIKLHIALFCTLLYLTTGCNSQDRTAIEKEDTTPGQDDPRAKIARMYEPKVTIDAAMMARYAFINYDSNRLEYGGEATPLKKMIDKWRRVVTTGEGEINIVHIGASHVQAGVFPNSLRRRILQTFPDRVGGRGLIFPYSAAKRCNNPLDYSVRCKESMTLDRCVFAQQRTRLGASGIAVTTTGVATDIAIALNDNDIKYGTTKVELIGEWYPREGGNGRTGMPEMPAVLQYEEAVEQFELAIPSNSRWDYTLRGLLLSGPEGGISLHSIGVNGASVGSYLRCPYFCEDMKKIKPDIVIFGLGINDASGVTFDTAYFHRKYIALADSIKKVNPEVAFIYITNNDCRFMSHSGNRPNPNGKLAREVFYRLAKETQGAVWDLFSIMGGYRSIDRWREAGLAKKDCVHFTNEGYTLLGELLAQALLKEIFEAETGETTGNRNSK